ncbi:hypothetical protein [Streptomyces sp. NPDC001642]|uniref:hypothetical protein n=1 Tax=Streptomyces sp. NPDC001642 TaxID=3154392 RepID=UPI00387ED22B
MSRQGVAGISGAIRGHSFHTSRWDHGCTGGDADGGLTGLAGKHVGLIGTGAPRSSWRPISGATHGSCTGSSAPRPPSTYAATGAPIPSCRDARPRLAAAP